MYVVSDFYNTVLDEMVLLEVNDEYMIVVPHTLTVTCPVCLSDEVDVKYWVITPPCFHVMCVECAFRVPDDCPVCRCMILMPMRLTYATACIQKSYFEDKIDLSECYIDFVAGRYVLTRSPKSHRIFAENLSLHVNAN